MSTNLSEVRGNPVAKEQPRNFPAMLKMFASEIERALPAHITATRMTRIALTAFNLNPALANCDPKSVFAAVIMSSQLGLEIGIQGQAYLVPYGKQCQFIAGWQGLVDMVSRSGRASVWTGAVYEGDEFDYGMGSEQWIKHKAGDNHGISKVTHVYAVGKIKESEHSIIEVWTIKRVENHRDKYNKVGKRHYSYENLEMYGRKVALLQVLKYMPKSVELRDNLEMLEHTQGRNLDLKDAIEGTWTPAPPEPEQIDDKAQTVQATTPSSSDDFVRDMQYAEGGNSLE